MDATRRSRLAHEANAARRPERSRTIKAQGLGSLTRTTTLGLLSLTGLLALAACTDAIDGRGSTTIEARFTGHGSPLDTTATGSGHEFENTAPRPRQDTWLYVPKVTREQTVLARAFPTGRVETSTVLLHQVSPIVADLGQPFVLEYHVTNLTETTLDEVCVHLHDAANLTLLDCSVHPMLDETSVYWPLGQLGPGQTRVVRVSARADSEGAAETVATVTYRNVLRSQTQVVEPKLRVKKTAPECCARDDVFEMVYHIINDGSGTARKITLTDDLPAGLTTIDGHARVSLPVLALGPGQTEERRVRVRASRTGSFSSAAVAVGEPELLAKSESPSIRILDPEIAIRAEHSTTGNEPASSTLTVTLINTGPVTARASRVTVPIAGERVISTSAPAAVGAESLILGCETLEPGKSIEFEIVLRGVSEGERVLVTAVADHAKAVRAEATLADGERVAAASPR